jgi:hypothetical protein
MINDINHVWTAAIAPRKRDLEFEIIERDVPSQKHHPEDWLSQVIRERMDNAVHHSTRAF